MKPQRLTIWRSAISPRNSICGSANLRDLDWSNWWTDGSDGAFYLHVRRLHPELDGNCEAHATWHRVYCSKMATPRLGLRDGRIFWLLPNPKAQP